MLLQATRPQLTRWLDSVGAVWSKAVIGATLLTAVALPFMGVPFLGDRGALYRAMGVLTAGGWVAAGSSSSSGCNVPGLGLGGWGLGLGRQEVWWRLCT